MVTYGSVVYGCDMASAVDWTGQASVSITYSYGADMGYSPRCVKISAGTQVTFTAPPVHPIKGGDVADYPTTTSVPPMNIPDFTSATLTFSNPGTYPYYCSVHGPGTFLGDRGAIFVVP
jgi:plastocyanin